MAEKIGILYVCTGIYSMFWEGFYRSFEKNFLPRTEKHYFVYTDAAELYGEAENARIHKIYQNSAPWPLPTLLKYRTFLQQREELAQMDYLYQSNANILCNEVITEEEFLPDEQHPLLFTLHPGYMEAPPYDCPFERSPASCAYIPYNCGHVYVYGAMNGGRCEAFLRLMETLETDIETDLKHNIIAKWHDESHINHYVNTHDDYCILSPAYGYPTNFDIEYPKKLIGIDKATVFDVAAMKGMDSPPLPPMPRWRAWLHTLNWIWQKKYRAKFMCGWDTIRGRKLPTEL